MQVASAQQSEIQITLEVLFDLANLYVDGDVDLRGKLHDAGFPRAKRAPAASVSRLEDRLMGLSGLIRNLPDLDVGQASVLVNEELTELAIAPSIVEHDGVGPHLHWTPATATFDDQVLADMLMAVAHELCDNGTIRFGRCGAEDCEDIFYDGTRNRSRRFCDDPRCASRTHTADHRARQKKSSGS